jgi:hypothetical protein
MVDDEATRLALDALFEIRTNTREILRLLREDDGEEEEDSDGE